MAKPSEAQQQWLDELVTLGGGGRARPRVSTKPTASVSLVRAASAEGMNASAQPQSQGGVGAVKIGAMVELSSKEFSPYVTRYGSLVIQATVKTMATIELGAGGTTGFNGTATSKDKPSGRTIGTKKNISYQGIGDRELFAGFDIKNISKGVEYRKTTQRLHRSTRGGRLCV